MTFEELRNEMILKTELKIDEIKARDFELPENRYDFSKIYNDISNEILEYAIGQAYQIVDRHHLRFDMTSFIAYVENDLYALTGKVYDVFLLRSRFNNQPKIPQLNRTEAKGNRIKWPLQSNSISIEKIFVGSHGKKLKWQPWIGFTLACSIIRSFSSVFRWLLTVCKR